MSSVVKDEDCFISCGRLPMGGGGGAPVGGGFRPDLVRSSRDTGFAAGSGGFPDGDAPRVTETYISCQ